MYQYKWASSVGFNMMLQPIGDGEQDNDCLNTALSSGLTNLWVMEASARSVS
jgi:hypothetical protein